MKKHVPICIYTLFQMVLQKLSVIGGLQLEAADNKWALWNVLVFRKGHFLI